MKAKIGILLFFILTLMTACSTDQNLSVNDSAHIKEEEVVNALKEKGVELIKTNSTQNSIFSTKLKGVKPGSYTLNEKPFFIYEFKTEEAREKGIKAFQEKTATMDLVSSSMFVKRNILIFYVHEQDGNIPFEKEIQEGLDSLIEG